MFHADVNKREKNIMDFRQGISEVFLSVGEEKKNKLVLEYGFFSDLLKAHKTYLTCQKKDKH